MSNPGGTSCFQLVPCPNAVCLPLGPELCDLPSRAHRLLAAPLQGHGARWWMLWVRLMSPRGSRGTSLICLTFGLSFVNRNLRTNRPALALLPAKGSSRAWRPWPGAGKRGEQGENPTEVVARLSSSPSATAGDRGHEAMTFWRSGDSWPWGPGQPGLGFLLPTTHRFVSQQCQL